MVIDHIEELVELCIPDEDEQTEWSLAIEFYREGMVLALAQERGPNG